MIDTHAHVSFRQFDEDRDLVLARARAAGIAAIIHPGTDREESKKALALAEREGDVFAAVGVHPQDAASFSLDDERRFEEFLRHPRVVAVGEVGFENTPRAPAMEAQQRVLAWFVDRAQQAGKPLIIHVRDAHAEFRKFLAARTEPLRGVVHCFSGSSGDADACVDRGFFLGVTGIVTFPNAKPLQEIVKRVPLSRLLLETDAPFLAPQSHRGKRNEPAYLPEVAEAIARLKGTPLEEVIRVTDSNAEQLFHLPRR